MNIAVRYYTRSGNTKTLADAIAKEAGVAVQTVAVPLDEKVDILFLGSSVYAGGIDKSVKEFIISQADKIGTIVNFSTAAALSSTYKQVRKVASSVGVSMSPEEFHCRGSFAMMHKGRPNAKDIQNVITFTKQVLQHTQN